MPRTPAVDRNELKLRVVEAVHALRGGRTPTVSLVRQWLTERYKGAGSQTILKDVLKETLSEIAAAESSGAPAIPMPAEVETIIHASIQTVWRVASQAAVKEYEERRNQADIAISEANTAREIAESQFATLEQERDDLEREVAKARRTIRDLEKRLAASEEQGRGLERQLETAETRAQQERVAADEARTRLDDMRDHLATTNAAREAADRRCRDLEQMGEDLAGRLRSAEARAGELEQRLGATEARAAGERDGFGKLENSLRREIDEANARAGSVHATIEGLMAQVATLATRGEGGHRGGSMARPESVGPE